MQLNTAVAFRKGEANAHGWKDNNIYVKDVSADGDVQTIDEEDLAKRAGQLPDHINDSVLFWKEDEDAASADATGETERPVEPNLPQAYDDDAGRDPGRQTDAVGATPPAGKSLWPIIWWCVGIGAAIGVTLALWKTARESKAKKQDESQE